MQRSSKALKVAVLLPISLLVSCLIVLLMLLVSGGFIQGIVDRSEAQVPMHEYRATYSLDVSFSKSSTADSPSHTGTYSYEISDRTIYPEELENRRGGDLHEVYQEG